jgi:hypothetical protein
MNKNGKDLTKEPPRSPKTRVGGYVILGRTIDKCRALLWGNIGEYHFDCPLDNMLFGWKRIIGDDFKADKMEEFRAAMQQIVKYADSAHSAALHSGKHLKHTEIKIREISNHLRDIKGNVDAEEQPPVQAVIDRLEGFRTELLHSMFGSKSND